MKLEQHFAELYSAIRDLRASNRGEAARAHIVNTEREIVEERLEAAISTIERLVSECRLMREERK